MVASDERTAKVGVVAGARIGFDSDSRRRSLAGPWPVCTTGQRTGAYRLQPGVAP